MAVEKSDDGLYKSHRGWDVGGVTNNPVVLGGIYNLRLTRALVLLGSPLLVRAWLCPVHLSCL